VDWGILANVIWSHMKKEKRKRGDIKEKRKQGEDINVNRE
jgi:hypothetical protein